ncbi:MAG: class I SAM-dependent methyltransferase [Acidimicrobiales bacterium]
MDDLTIQAYDRDPDTYADDWSAQPAPSDLHALVLTYFRPGPTADVGCGSGRDTAWLRSEGFDAVGFDVSEGLLAEARRRHPQIEFSRASLPDLAGIAEGSFENVLCETVIMHMAVPDIDPSVKRMLAILRDGGTLYLSWRVTVGEDHRTHDGRLYSAFDTSVVNEALDGVSVLHDSESVSASSGRKVHRIVARKDALAP